MARITVVGSGVVGQASGRGFLHHGHEVTFVDVKPEIIDRLRAEGLTAMYPDEVAWADADVTMLAINTPTVSGKIRLEHLLHGVRTVASGLSGSTRYQIVVIRSTVPPTTTVKTILPILEACSGRRAGHTLGIAMNPEFLRQVSANEDFLEPWLTVFGTYGETEAAILGELYAPFNAPIVSVDCTTAEVIKYANNLYNATKISFFNEFHLVCERLGVDSRVVGHAISRSAEGMWNPSYGTRGGWPYGGACLPKDTAAFFEFAHDRLGLEMPLLSGTMRVNDILEGNVMAPTSMHEVIPASELINDARSSVDHAVNVAISGALESDFVDHPPEPVVAMPMPVVHDAAGEEIVAP
jgi:UDPglucose 6-dehydrogenase